METPEAGGTAAVTVDGDDRGLLLVEQLLEGQGSRQERTISSLDGSTTFWAP